MTTKNQNPKVNHYSKTVICNCGKEFDGTIEFFRHITEVNELVELTK